MKGKRLLKATGKRRAGMPMTDFGRLIASLYCHIELHIFEWVTPRWDIEYTHIINLPSSSIPLEQLPQHQLPCRLLLQYLAQELRLAFSPVRQNASN